MGTANPVAWARPVILALGAASIVVLAGASAADAGSAPAFERSMAVLIVGCCLIGVRHIDPAWFGAVAIALTVFSGHWESLGIPLPLDRVLLFAAIVAALVRHRREPSPRTRIIRPVHGFLLAALLVAVVSAIWVGTLGDRATRFALLDTYGIVPFGMFICAPFLFPGVRERAVLLGTLVLTGAYLGATAVFETIGADALIWPRYILDSGLGIHAERARGPFTEAVADGLGLYACGAAAAVALVTWRRPIARAAAAGVMALCAAGLLFTLTRSIWLASALATVVVMLAGRSLRRYIVPAAIVVTLSVAAMFALVPSFADRVQQRQGDERSIWDRQNLNAAAVSMVAERPLGGFGFGAARAKSLNYVWQGDDVPLTGANVGIHNAFLGLAVQLGVLGALLWALAFVFTVGSSACRRAPPGLEPWRLAVLAIAIQGLLVQNFVPGSYAFPILVTWVLAGCLGSAQSNALVGTGSERPERTAASFPRAVHTGV